MITFHVSQPVNGTEKYREGSCLSSDTKPVNDASMANGSKLMEMDTSTLYLYDKKNKTWRAWE